MKNIYEEPIFEMFKLKFEAVLDTIQYSTGETFETVGNEGNDDIIGGH